MTMKMMMQLGMIMGWVDPWVEDDEDDSVSSRRRCSHLASAVDVATGRW